MFLHCTPDRNSLRSRSPEDNSSLLSASAGSLDSALNHSREEEELKNLTLDSCHDEVHLSSDIGLIKQSVSQSEANHSWSDEAESIQQANSIADAHNHRNSNESGFVSIRSSTQSVSTKQVSNSTVTQQTNFVNASAAAAISNVIRKFDAISEQNATATSAATKTSFTTLENGSAITVSQAKVSQIHLSQAHITHTSINAKDVADGLEALNAQIDEVFSNNATDEKPPLPEKTRKSSVRRVSTYDNVDETDAAELR